MSPWEPGWTQRRDPIRTPYIDWVDAIGGGQATDRSDLDSPGSASRLVRASSVDLARIAQQTLPQASQSAHSNQPGKGGSPAINGNAVPSLKEALEGSPTIPEFAFNTFDQDEPWLPSDDALRALDIDDPDTVIVGVLDRGIALGHHRTRLTRDRTRILASWQQIADRRHTPIAETAGNRNLPCGLEFLGTDLNALLARHSLSGGAFDEDGFNAAVGAANFREVRGHRELSRHDSHGSHVLDLAAGADLGDVADDLRDRTRLMLVNLPDRALIGPESRYLEYFVLLGMFRMISLADKLWALKHGGDEHEGAFGYPMVLNLSFAKQAGPRDGTDLLSRFMKEINERRMAEGWRPVVLVTPVGNNNLDRGHAEFTLPATADAGEAFPSRSLNWRMLPDDQSANFVEVVVAYPVQVSVNPGIVLQVITPDGRVSTELLGEHEQFTEIPDVARIYCDLRDGHLDEERTVIRFVICTAPVLSQNASGTVAPGGRWQIRVVNRSAHPIRVEANVQIDQSVRLDGQTGRISYFDDPDYGRYDGMGRMLDTFASPNPDEPAGEKDFDAYDYDTSPPRRRGSVVGRKGTMNRLSRVKFHERPADLNDPDGVKDIIPGGLIAAGHRASDGRPAPYSSSGTDGGVGLHANINDVPSVSFPVDDGMAFPGVMSAGARDGSVAVLSGTSFASAQLTRWVARQYISNPDLPYVELLSRLSTEATQTEQNHATEWRGANRLKVGDGRLLAEVQRRP